MGQLSLLVELFGVFSFPLSSHSRAFFIVRDTSSVPLSACSLLKLSNLFLNSFAPLDEGFRALAPTLEVAFRIEAMSGVEYFSFLNLSVNSQKDEH